MAIKWDEMEDSAEMLQGLSDKELLEYLADDRVQKNRWRPFAVEESNRRQLNKIAKSPMLTVIAFGLIVLTFIFTVLSFFFK